MRTTAAITAAVFGANFAAAAPWSKPATSENARRGLLDMQSCSSDDDCPGSFTCTGESSVGTGKSCALWMTDVKHRKRIVNVNGHGTCDVNDDCASHLECRQVYKGYEGRWVSTDPVNVCLPPKESKRSEGLSARASGNCDADSDCRSGWYCDELYDGLEGTVDAIRVCLPDGNDKRDLVSGPQPAKRADTCSSDSDCSSGKFCDSYYTWDAASSSITTAHGCFDKVTKRDADVEPRASTCASDSDCSDGKFCDSYYTWDAASSSITTAYGCFDKVTKRDAPVTPRANGNCDNNSDCAKYGSSWYCDQVYEGTGDLVDPVNVCLPGARKRDVEERAHGNCDADSDCSKYGSSWYCDQVYEGGSLVDPVNVCLPGAASKRGLRTRAHGNCDVDSDCHKYGSRWTCDEVYEGSSTVDAIKVCIP